MAWDDDKSTAADPDNPAANEQVTADEWDAMVADQKSRVLYGALADRPSAGSVAEDTVYLVTDLANDGGVLTKVVSGAWQIQQIGDASNRPDMFGDMIDANAVDAEEASVGGTELFVWLNSQQSVTSGSIETIQLDTVEDDAGSEWDGGNYQFTPTETADYWIMFSVESRDSADGDELLARFRDVDAGSTALRARSSGGGGSFETNSNAHRRELTAGNAHELQFRNNTTDDTIEVGRGATFLVVRRAV